VSSITPGLAGTRVTRRISADPTSTALLLAGPTAVDLWPGVRRVGESAGRVVVEAELDGVSLSAAVRARPPKRTPTSYVTQFEFVGTSLPLTNGRLTLTYAPGTSGPATWAVLTLHREADLPGAVDAVALEAMAERFLDNLARAAEERSRAA
jgi:hypothetical protein